MTKLYVFLAPSIRRQKKNLPPRDPPPKRCGSRKTYISGGNRALARGKRTSTMTVRHGACQSMAVAREKRWFTTTKQTRRKPYEARARQKRFVAQGGQGFTANAHARGKNCEPWTYQAAGKTRRFRARSLANTGAPSAGRREAAAE